MLKTGKARRDRTCNQNSAICVGNGDGNQTDKRPARYRWSLDAITKGVEVAKSNSNSRDTWAVRNDREERRDAGAAAYAWFAQIDRERCT